MDFNKRNTHSLQGISDTDAGMRQRSRIDNDEINSLCRRFLDSANQFMLGITLEIGKLGPD